MPTHPTSRSALLAGVAVVCVAATAACSAPVVHRSHTASSSSASTWSDRPTDLPSDGTATVLDPPRSVPPRVWVRPIPGTVYAKLPTTKVWYGWQVLLVDVSWMAMLGSASVTGDPGLSVLGVVGYPVGGPVVHLMHGKAQTALASFGIRSFVPLVGAAFGVASSDCRDIADDTGLLAPFVGVACVGYYAGIGAMVGMAAAITVDAVFLAEKEVPVGAPTIVPTVQVTPTGSFFGLTGHF